MNEEHYSALHEQLLRKYFTSIRILQDVEEQLKRERMALKQSQKEFEEYETLLKASREPGYDTAEILQCISDSEIIVRSSNGPRYLTNKRTAIPLKVLQPGTRVGISSQSQTILTVLPPAIDPYVFKFSDNGANKVTFQDIGGLNYELNLIREAIELPITNPEIFEKVGIEASKSVLLTGPPGVGKSLICQAFCNQLDCTFIKLVGSQIVQKYIGESSRLIREIFAYARLKSPSILMIDEIDSICGKRSAYGSSSDREIARTMLALLTELDGFSSKENDKVKCVFCTNRPKSLDPAFLRPGRISRKITIPLPNAAGRLEILQIHARGIRFDDSCDFGRVVALSEGFNGADLKCLVTEAGLCAIRRGCAMVGQEDLLEACRVMQKNKVLEGKTWDQGSDAMN